MGRDLNKVMIFGHLGHDQETRYMPSGKPGTPFTFATSHSRNAADAERKVGPVCFNRVIWGNLAEICKQYLAKGQQGNVEGRLQIRRWDDGAGIKHSGIEIVANKMLILGERRDTVSLQNRGTIESEQVEVEYPF
jgi:single-strand DNA-binding protein